MTLQPASRLQGRVLKLTVEGVCGRAKAGNSWSERPNAALMVHLLYSYATICLIRTLLKAAINMSRGWVFSLCVRQMKGLVGNNRTASSISQTQQDGQSQWKQNMCC